MSSNHSSLPPLGVLGALIARVVRPAQGDGCWLVEVEQRGAVGAHAVERGGGAGAESEDK